MEYTLKMLSSAYLFPKLKMELTSVGEFSDWK